MQLETGSRSGKTWNQIQEETEFISLFDDEKFTSVNAMIEHMKDKYHFDLAAVQDQFGIYFETLPRS